MIDNLYQDTLSYRDKILSILCYIWLVPLIIIFIPRKSRFVKRKLIQGIILSAFITCWIISILVIVKKDFDLQMMNIINGVILGLIIVFEIIQIVRIIRRKSY